MNEEIGMILWWSESLSYQARVSPRRTLPQERTSELPFIAGRHG